MNNHRTAASAQQLRDQFTAWLTASCQRQALPVTVTDPTTLATVAALLRYAKGCPSRHGTRHQYRQRSIGQREIRSNTTFPLGDKGASRCLGW